MCCFSADCVTIELLDSDQWFPLLSSVYYGAGIHVS